MQHHYEYGASSQRTDIPVEEMGCGHCQAEPEETCNQWNKGFRWVGEWLNHTVQNCIKDKNGSVSG